DDVGSAVGLEPVRLAALQGTGFPGDLRAEIELVRARAGDGIDDAARGASVFHGVPASLDLEFLVERVRDRGGTDAIVEISNVQSIDVDRILCHRRAAEGNTTVAEIAVALGEAGCEQR